MTEKEQVAMKAINEIFNDMSITQDETKSMLKGLVEEIEMLIDTLNEN